MKVKIIKKIIPWARGETNAFCFLPEHRVHSVAIFPMDTPPIRDAILPWASKIIPSWNRINSF